MQIHTTTLAQTRFIFSLIFLLQKDEISLGSVSLSANIVCTAPWVDSHVSRGAESVCASLVCNVHGFKKCTLSTISGLHPKMQVN